MPGLRVLYGGTFDPVHNGHLAIARAARTALQAEIHLMPAADPPHRPPPGAAAGDRAAMLQLALAGEPGLRLDLRELQRGGRSYSVDTLRGLRGELGAQAPIALLLGADSFLGLPAWKAWRELFGLAHFVVASRAGAPLDAELPPALAAMLQDRVVAAADALRAHPAGRVLYLRQPLHAQSASDIRARIAGGRPWRHLLPAAVADYIRARGLYAPGAGVNGP
ncbi:nicotinate-nucleotide adenylyltransferase [Cognatiluteimonas weifangensis]|uniref:Probable nicotinate-nucleotide adenylyltransferase n=1 Tax=Cognatiluteimonas weifangensis TaxID=2303539 RepID=A0A372DRU0_9GAMM|nr:nicotinate-nucleotide adenylyltransferase [Luteimonas weifangensis]RFP62288.1 nicotinate-nucleotide adenylyltransferase [Luteimonas weifangensis]